MPFPTRIHYNVLFFFGGFSLCGKEWLSADLITISSIVLCNNFLQLVLISLVPYFHVLEMCDSSDSDASEYSDSPAKRRRRGGGDGGAGTSGTASASTPHEVGTAISKSASIIAEAIQACEEREERRHRDLLNLHERRLQLEESKTEINRQGVNGLVDAINKLANSILALASNKHQSAPK